MGSAHIPAIFDLVLVFLRRFHCRPGRKKEAKFSVPPNPFLPSIVSGLLALLFLMLGLPPEGFYHFSDGSAFHAGMYARGSKGLNKFGFDKFAFEDVQANRTRFGWPFRTITPDVVPRESEWHLVFETFWFANNLFFFVVRLAMHSTCFRRPEMIVSLQ